MTTRLGPFPRGMNNRAKDTALPEGTARNLVNVDIDSEGKARRRKGSGKVVSCVGAHSGFETSLGSFYVDGGYLKKFNAGSPVTLCPLAGDFVAYEEFNGVVYLSDGVVTKKITSGGVKNWGIATPEQPVLHPVSGSLPEGQYLAAITFVGIDGVESGASEIQSIALTSGGITFANLPNNPDANQIRLYLSTANGSILYRVATISAGTFSYPVIAGGHDENASLETAFVSEIPAGKIIRQHKGKLYIVDVNGQTLWETSPYSLDHVRPAEGFTQHPGEISNMEPCGMGIFVVASKTYYMTDENYIPVLPYGGIPGTGGKVKNSNRVSWMSERGLVVGMPDGSVQNIQEDNVATGAADSGSILHREQDGIRQAVISMKNPTVSTMAASSFIEAEVIRKGE